jgi:hypothetical protein
VCEGKRKPGKNRLPEHIRLPEMKTLHTQVTNWVFRTDRHDLASLVEVRSCNVNAKGFRTWNVF